jgi:hypothetical protein
MFNETGLTAEKLRTDETEKFQIKRDIKRWFITYLLHGTFFGSADTVLRRVRESSRSRRVIHSRSTNSTGK